MKVILTKLIAALALLLPMAWLESAGALECRSLFAERPAPQPRPALALEFATREYGVTSRSTFASLLLEIADVSQADMKVTTERLAGLLFSGVGTEGAQRIAHALLYNHRHIASGGLHVALAAFRAGETDAAKLAALLPPPLEREAFLRWSELGIRLERDRRFLLALELAALDLQEAGDRRAVSTPSHALVREILTGLHELKSPSLAGWLAESFLRASRQTRQRLLSRMVE